ATVTVQTANGTTQEKTVEIGIRNRVQAQVLSGLEDGDTVVVNNAAADQAGTNRRNNRRPGMFYRSRPMSALIKLDNIRKSFHNGDLSVEVLHGISLEIKSGEFVAIIGASGSGKSTLMNILGCLDNPSSGQYLLDGEDVADLDADELAGLR